MATNGKPTTTFAVTYGRLNEQVAQTALAPVLIAPRYAVIDKDDELSVLGTFSDIATSGEAERSWPGHTEGAIVDFDSGELFVKDAIIRLNDEAISAAATGSLITLQGAGSVKLGANSALYAQLGGVEVAAGDVVQIEKADGATVTAEVVDIQPTYTESEPTIAAMSTNTATSGLTADATGMTTTQAVAYLVKFTEAGADATEVTAEISGILGDEGMRSTVKLSATPIAIGSSGLKLALGEGSDTIVAGDSFVVTVPEDKPEAYNKVFVNVTVGDITSCSVYFASSKLAAEYTPVATTGWSANEAGLTIGKNIVLNIGGASKTLVDGELRMTYRELLTADSMQLYSSNYDGVAEFAGKADPRNPMGMMYACASQVSGGFFYLMAPVADTEQAYIDAVNYVAKFEQVYSSVSYRQTKEIQAAICAMLNKYSSKEISKYKRSWLAPTVKKRSLVYSADAQGAALIGSVKGNKLSLEGAASIVAAGIRKGDIVRIYGGAAANRSSFGYSEYEITSVNSATEATLTDVPAGGIGISRVEFLRDLSSAEYAKALAAEARSISNRRVNFVVADKLQWGSFDDVDKAYLAATLATMRGALPPHAPMNELVIPGFTLVDANKWTDIDYEEMNAGGCWIVYNNDADEVVTYHQITTVTDNTIAEEDSAMSNGDAIVRALRAAVRPIAAGKANVSTAILATIDKVLRANIDYIKSIDYPDIYGPQILDYEIKDLYIPEGNRKAIRCRVGLELPLPLQDGEFEFNLI